VERGGLLWRGHCVLFCLNHMVVACCYDVIGRSLLLWCDVTVAWQHRINYRVEGPEDGPPLLLIHGFGQWVDGW
jgi:hypothetical protein